MIALAHAFLAAVEPVLGSDGGGLDASEKIALAAVIASGIVAVTVPTYTMRSTARQAHDRWILERKADFYEELLAYCTLRASQIERYVGMAHEPLTIKQREERAGAIGMSPDNAMRFTARARMYASQKVDDLFWSYQLDSDAFVQTMDGHLRRGTEIMGYGHALDEAREKPTATYQALRKAIREELRLLASEPRRRWWGKLNRRSQASATKAAEAAKAEAGTG